MFFQPTVKNKFLITTNFWQVSLKIEHDKVNVKLTMSGPSDVWFGVGFDASTMADKPYAIIVDGNGDVRERKLENHSPGSLIQPGSIRVP